MYSPVVCITANFNNTCIAALSVSLNSICSIGLLVFISYIKWHIVLSRCLVRDPSSPYTYLSVTVIVTVTSYYHSLCYTYITAMQEVGGTTSDQHIIDKRPKDICQYNLFQLTQPNDWKKIMSYISKHSAHTLWESCLLEMRT